MKIAAITRTPTAQSGSSSKRGIKTTLSFALKVRFEPRVGHPAKEGLRPVPVGSIKKLRGPQSGSSSKRGIKTARDSSLIALRFQTQSGSSSKRGIKTPPLTDVQSVS